MIKSIFYICTGGIDGLNIAVLFSYPYTKNKITRNEVDSINPFAYAIPMNLANIVGTYLPSCFLLTSHLYIASIPIWIYYQWYLSFKNSGYENGILLPQGPSSVWMFIRSFHAGGGIIVMWLWGHPYYSGNMLDCWSTGRAINLATGICFMTNSFAQDVPGPV